MNGPNTKMLIVVLFAAPCAAAMAGEKSADEAEVSPYAQALALVFATQKDAIRDVDQEDWWHDVKERAWSVKRPFRAGTVDSTHLFNVSYRIDRELVASWLVDTRGNRVERRSLGEVEARKPSPAAPISGGWSEAANGLAGRLLVSQQKITQSGFFLLTLELRNTGSSTLAVEAHSLCAFRVKVLDSDGNAVRATMMRIDVSSYPRWALLPPQCCLGIPVSMQSIDGAKGSHLDITTEIWRLEPGKYTIRGAYSSNWTQKFDTNRRNEKAWQGKLSLPPVEVEVTDAGK